MFNRAEALTSNGFHLFGLAKKKKSGNFNREAKAGLCSPLSSDHSSVFSWHIEGQDTKNSKVPGKKSKEKKARKEPSDSQVDNPWVTTESESNSEAGTGTCVRKKKKKKKKRKKKTCRPCEQEGGGDLYVPETPERAGSQPEDDDFDNVGALESTPFWKKKKKALLLAEQVEASRASNRHRDADLSDAEGTQRDFFAPSPPSAPQTQDLNVSQEVVELEFNSPVARKKLHKRRIAPSAHDSIATNVGLMVEGSTKSVGKREQVLQQCGSPLKLSSSVGDNRLQKPPTIACSDAEESSPTKSSASSTFFLVDNEFVESSKLNVKDLDSVTQELEEFIPHIRCLSTSAVKQLASRDLIRFKNFKREGISVKFGKFSKKENDQLERNIEAFLMESGIESAEKLLFAHRFPQEKDAINKLKSENLFGTKIAQGIPRPWRLVYYRARKIFDPQNYNGRYSEVEKKKLKKYQAMYGNNWKKISDLMYRSSHSVQLKYSQIKCDPKSGPWSEEETEKLIQAVEETLRSKVKGLDSALTAEDGEQALMLLRENLYKGISWIEIEAKVGTRHWRQCKQKWLSVLTKRMSGGQTRNHGLENLQVKINLIERLYELNIEDTNEIDWEDLSTLVGNVPPDYVRSRFYRIKATHVPRWNEKTFPEIIDHLYEVTLPELKRKMAKRTAAVKPSQAKDCCQKKVFQFSDIFHHRDWISDTDSSSEKGGSSDSDADS
ncbi:transcription termination factor 1 isoform X2 [Rhineura floridana]|nr:transcription termination factor 1 isoform X2 [Rhineura floridana]XP_061460189.1 transcription termination factor 1 isoform X2 [Rhineura floridana]XP_061460190.1 transcription termination factor 1 isoform X2 [Rhineura floridana]XP_061460192.1 transcription termination factor 1 isoform X2 [Rhineura floridana]XP_061460193.1 transcription termination factor 1 isoform X2 [Rhineura floridana]